ncbi:MaoC family dehydratase [Bosea sp. ASV33]|uniref:MaoC family dehydratase n=1 Tax=Bosea sp. ASV33 TaxID=2795106 RepID=UPI0018EE04CC|nr:MaoC family dehydratase [Bosea sp. ASV33]
MAVNYQELATGKYYEELEVGNLYKHSITRTVTEADNLLFSTLTYNSAWLHMDEEYCKATSHGKRLVNSLFTLALANGVTVNDTTLGTTEGNLGFYEVKFTAPVYIGDTLRSETEIISKRESKSRPHSGIVEFETRSYNQRDQMVLTFRRAGMMIKKSSLTAK